MTRIGNKKIITEEDQGFISFHVAGAEKAQFSSTGAFLDSVNGIQFRSLTGGVSSVTAASATSAGSTSATTSTTVGLTGVCIAHGLAAAPTLYGVISATSATAVADLVGKWVTADASYITVSFAAAVTASKPYSYNWYAAP